MYRAIRMFCIPAILIVASAIGMAKPAAPEESLIIVYADGHRQALESSDVARIELKSPVTVVYKDGRKQTIAASEGARLEFESAAAGPIPSRYHFVGKWEVGDGNGTIFYITLDADGEAKKTHGASHGTWTVVNGEARISWDDGWHDAIRKVGSRHEKVAFEPGRSFDDAPSNITAAKNTQAKPI